MLSFRRMQREETTIAAMIAIYCRRHHGGGNDLCQDCRELLAYARKRLRHCPFQEGKTTCGNCAVHCYKPAMRERIRQVMRAIGPGMIFSHPFLAFMHLLDGMRRKPVKKKRQNFTRTE
ncbi:MAG: nitrous oxide-stimulated promoter family protein [Thermodesulfobacteriota bacterium]